MSVSLAFSEFFCITGPNYWGLINPDWSMCNKVTCLQRNIMKNKKVCSINKFYMGGGRIFTRS